MAKMTQKTVTYAERRAQRQEHLDKAEELEAKARKAPTKAKSLKLIAEAKAERLAATKLRLRAPNKSGKKSRKKGKNGGKDLLTIVGEAFGG